MGIIDERKFKQVKKALNSNAKRNDIVKYMEISLESIRLIKNCADWDQWQQNKINRNVARQNSNRSFIQKLIGFFGGKV